MNLLSYLYRCLFITSIFCLTFPSSIQAQCEDTVEDPRDATDLHIIIEPNKVGNVFHFKICNKPSLPAIAELADYLYFWDFGDGTYSFEENPFHSYLNPSPPELPYQVRAYVVMAYVNPKGAIGTMRTSVFSNGTTVSLPINADQTIDAYMDEDGYTKAEPSGDPIHFQTAFDLVPGYLTPFILTLAHPNPGVAESRQVVMTYPQGMFSPDILTNFINPDNPAEISNPEEVQRNPPESPEAIYPISAGPNYLPGEPGAKDSVTFSVNFPSDATNPLHVFFNLFASPFLPLDIDAEFEFFLMPSGAANRSNIADAESLTQGITPSSSHDPNYKFVDFKAPANKDKVFIAGNKPALLTFRLAFQNEGNAPEDQIKVLDTIAPEINFSTIQLLGITLGDGNIPKSICDYPPIWRDMLWDSINPADPNHYYEMQKNPDTRVVSWEFKTYLAGIGMTDLTTGDSIDEKFTWGYIDFQAYTNCGLKGFDQFTNRAGVYFGAQEVVMTNDIQVINLCYDDSDFIYRGAGSDIDLVRIARKFYPNNRFSPSSVVLTKSLSGIKTPSKIPSRGGEYSYSPDTTLFSQLDTISWINRTTKERVLVDLLEYVICDTFAKQCYPVSAYLMIDPDNQRDQIPAFDCSGDCVEAEAYKEPYPKWWYAVLGLILLLFLIISAIRRRRRN